MRVRAHTLSFAAWLRGSFLPAMALVAVILLLAPGMARGEAAVVYFVEEGAGALEPGSAEGYINKLMDPSQRFNAEPRSTLSDRLSEKEQYVYRQLAEQVALVAAGERASTIFEFPAEAVYGKTAYTPEELGVSAILSDGSLTDEARAAISAVLTDISIPDIITALRRDYPYEMYWAGLQYGWSYPGYAYYSDGSEVFLDGNLTITIAVGQEYSAGEYAVDTSWGQRAAAAAENAAAIVEHYASASTYAKLTGYRDSICELVSYNHEAADDDSTPYGNPWQLIWVFDGDETTNVVCEGYAKAFKYLVDRSSSAAHCYIATGTMSGGTGAGPHMWNVVGLGGSYYLVDVTNCDEGSIGYPDELFMKGYSAVSTEVSGDFTQYDYIYIASGVDIHYVFTSDSLSGAEILYSGTDYGTTQVENHLTAGPAGGVDSFTGLYGETVTMAVEASCDEGELSYYWSGDDLPSSAGGSSLSVVVERGYRAYTCRVTDEFGNSVSVTFRVYLDNITIEDNGTSTGSSYANVGDTVTLWVQASCEVGGLSYEWHYVTSEESFLLEGETADALTVTIESLPAQYVCIVSDEFGSSNHVWFELFYDNGLEIVNAWQSQQRVRVGDTVTMGVEAVCASGELTYDWRQDLNAAVEWEYDEQLGAWVRPTNERLLDWNLGNELTITIDELPAEYDCWVRDDFGNAQCESFIFRLDNEFTAQEVDSNLTVPLGEAATLEVQASCREGSLRYEWSVQNAEGIWVVIDGATESTLILEAVTESGHYLCHVTDDYDDQVYLHFTVTLDNQLQATAVGDTWFYPFAGEQITLAVDASCLRGALHYGWMKTTSADVWVWLDGDTPDVAGYDGPELTVTNVSASADYQCVVTDDYGNTANVWFYVHAQSDLAFDAVTPAGLIARLTDVPMTLRAEAVCSTGDVTYSWKRIGEDEVLSTDQALSVFSAGTYLCNAWDVYGNCVTHAFRVFDGDAAELALDERASAETPNFGMPTLWAFTPKATGTYVLTVDTTEDTAIYLYDEDWNELATTYDPEDYGHPPLSQELAFGRTYVYAVCMRSEGIGGTLPVTLTLQALKAFEPDITLPASLKRIEADAFADIPAGAVVYVPATVTAIEDGAFDPGTVLITPAGSWAESWALSHGFETRNP